MRTGKFSFTTVYLTGKATQWLSQTQPDQHDTFAASQALYGLLLLKAGQPDAAHHWLQQSRHLLLRENWQEALLQNITRTLDWLDEAPAIDTPA